MEHGIKIEVLKYHPEWVLGRAYAGTVWHIWPNRSWGNRYPVALCGYKVKNKNIDVGGHWTRHELGRYRLCPKCKDIWVDEYSEIYFREDEASGLSYP